MADVAIVSPLKGRITGPGEVTEVTG